jgi:D-alanyl-D-alanine dipeptidase
MKKKYLWMLFAIFAIVCSVSVITYNNSKEDAPSVSPTDNSSEFVTLTDAVPDAILEIRYYGTYNFVGQRIDGYEEPIALLLPRLLLRGGVVTTCCDEVIRQI